MAQMGVIDEVSMKSRKMITFGDITETVLSMLKTEADTIFGEDDGAKAESAVFMSGVINLWYMLDRKTEADPDDAKTVFEGE